MKLTNFMSTKLKRSLICSLDRYTFKFRDYEYLVT
jgi:hypothetical protein